ncbi:MAG: glycosyltransferase [Chitinivibrionales bacterium]|nr:glycosyltransferase [Chitinivibrionales bacterium]
MIVSITIVVCGLVSLYYCWTILFLYRGLKQKNCIYNESPNRFSVIIAAHNEEETIQNCLNHCLNQTYPIDFYEIIVVNDRSTDGTAAAIESIAQRVNNLKHITITSTPDTVSPKKHALSMGIARAAHEIIVFTDADCTVQPTWLETINRHFTADVGLVQGMTSYGKPPAMNHLFFGLQAIDFLSHNIVAAAAIGAGMPINSNANNFAFRSEAYHTIHGFASVAAVVSGDDDLLLQKIWQSKKWDIRFMDDTGGAVVTEPSPNLRHLFEQRKRWGSKTIHYNLMQRLFLSGIFIFYILILIALVASFTIHSFAWLCIGMIILKALGEWLLLWPGTKRYNQTALLAYFPIATLIQFPLVVSAVIFGVFGFFRWKDQTFRRKMQS